MTPTKQRYETLYAFTQSGPRLLYPFVTLMLMQVQWWARNKGQSAAKEITSNKDPLNFSPPEAIRLIFNHC